MAVSPPTVQVFRERLKVLHSKITARNERIKLLMQRGSPDVDPLDIL
jgi:nesprin-1